MPTKKVTVPITDASQMIYVDALIGDAQDGAISVFLGPDEVATGTRIVHKGLATGAEIGQHSLVVSATVVDISEATDWTSVTLKLSGGASGEWESKAKVPSHGSLNHLFVVQFGR